MSLVRPSLARLFGVAALSATVAACGGSDDDSAPRAVARPHARPIPSARWQRHPQRPRHQQHRRQRRDGARVTAGNASATATDANGNYSMSNAPAGERTVVRVNATGFGEKASRSNPPPPTPRAPPTSGCSRWAA